MLKRPRSDSSLSEASTIKQETPDPSSTTIKQETPDPSSTVQRITRLPDDRSILIHIEENHIGRRASYQVSKDVLTEVRCFRELFSRNQEASTYRLEDDKFLAMKILFLILHHRLQDLPKFLFVSRLIDLATVCDRYEVAEIVVPHVETQKWVEHVWQDQKTHGKEWVDWLKILRGFYPREEQCDKLSIVLDVMAANISRVERDWVFEWNDYKCHVANIDCPTRAIMDLSLFLELRRERLWQDLRKACARLQEELLSANRDKGLYNELEQFKYRLQDCFSCSVTIVALLEELKQYLWNGAIEHKKILTERLEYFHDGCIDA